MPAPNFKYVWLLSGPGIAGVKVFNKRDRIEEAICSDGEMGLRKTETGTGSWEYEAGGKKFKAIKQKIEDSHGLAVRI